MCFYYSIFKEFFMKKKMFSLMLSAAIFTTCPLFAMDPEDDQGKGTLCKLPKEVLPNLLWQCPNEDVLKAREMLACTSKAMNVAFNDLSIWDGLSLKICTPFVYPVYSINEVEEEIKVWVKKTNIKNYCQLFKIEKNKNNSYNVTLGQLVSFHKKSYPDPEHPNSWCFSIGKLPFQLFKYGENVAEDYLKTLDQNLVLTFSWASPKVEGHNPWRLENLFYALVSLSPDDEYRNWEKEIGGPFNGDIYRKCISELGKDYKFSTDRNVFYISLIPAQVAPILPNNVIDLPLFGSVPFLRKGYPQ